MCETVPSTLARSSREPESPQHRNCDLLDCRWRACFARVLTSGKTRWLKRRIGLRPQPRTSAIVTAAAIDPGSKGRDGLADACGRCAPDTRAHAPTGLLRLVYTRLTVGHFKWLRDSRTYLLNSMSIWVCTDCSLKCSEVAMAEQHTASRR